MAYLRGTSGNDFIYGTRSADTIDGGARRDFLSGGDGDDTIIGGLGNDILVGGAGDDTFIFGELHDADRILDFGPNDTIDLDDDIDRYFVTETREGVRIATVDDEHPFDVVQGSIVLVGVTADEWTAWGGEFGEVEMTDSGTLIV